ncbi:MAG: hypothetical protein QM703_29970 [Gemmatales bacterium]
MATSSGMGAKGQHHSGACRCTFSAPELQEDREHVAQQNAQSHDSCHAGLGPTFGSHSGEIAIRQQAHRNRRFQEVEQKHDEEPLEAHDPADVGCPDVPASMLTDIDSSSRLGDEVAKGDGANEVSEDGARKYKHTVTDLSSGTRQEFRWDHERKSGDFRYTNMKSLS